MIMFSLLLLLLSNAVTLRRDKSILYSRISIIILIYSCLIGYNNLDFSFLENGIGLFTGFSFSTFVKLQIIGFLFMGFFSCFFVFGYIGVLMILTINVIIT